MGQAQKFKINQSLILIAKSFIAIFITLSLTHCFSGKKTPQIEEQKPQMTSPFGGALIELGESYSPHFSADGNYFLFVASKRRSHQHSQIYEFDLTKNKERRITFQDGENQQPIYLEKEKIAYSSSTDEIKEHPARLFPESLKTKKNKASFLPSDLYVSDRFGEEIIRITKSTGFDGFLFYKSNSTKKESEKNPEKIIYSHQTEDAMEIWSIDIDGKREKKLRSVKESLLLHPHWNEKKKRWLWIEQKNQNEDSQNSQLIIATSNFKEIQQQPLPEGHHAEFVLSEDEEKIVISSRIHQKEQFQIYGFDIPTGCFWSLLSHASQLREPSLSKNQKDLLFVSDASGVKKIYKTQVELTPKNCISNTN